jgi:hypothetical protein
LDADHEDERGFGRRLNGEGDDPDPDALKRLLRPMRMLLKKGVPNKAHVA